MEQLEDTLAGVDVALSDEVLDRIDEIVPPGESIGAMDMVYRGPEVDDQTMYRVEQQHLAHTRPQHLQVLEKDCRSREHP